MANLTSKELDALEDQLNFEHTWRLQVPGSRPGDHRDRPAQQLQPVTPAGISRFLTTC